MLFFIYLTKTVQLHALRALCPTLCASPDDITMHIRLVRNLRSLGADWDRRTVNEYENNIDDSSEGGLGQCESAGPLNAPGVNVGDDGSD